MLNGQIVYVYKLFTIAQLMGFSDFSANFSRGRKSEMIERNLKYKIRTPELRCVEQKLSRQLELIQKPLAELGTDPVPNACTEVNSTGCVIVKCNFRLIYQDTLTS